MISLIDLNLLQNILKVNFLSYSFVLKKLRIKNLNLIKMNDPCNENQKTCFILLYNSAVAIVS